MYESADEMLEAIGDIVRAGWRFAWSERDNRFTVSRGDRIYTDATFRVVVVAAKNSDANNV